MLIFDAKNAFENRAAKRIQRHKFTCRNDQCEYEFECVYVAHREFFISSAWLKLVSIRILWSKRKFTLQHMFRNSAARKIQTSTHRSTDCTAVSWKWLLSFLRVNILLCRKFGGVCVCLRVRSICCCCYRSILHLPNYTQHYTVNDIKNKIMSRCSFAEKNVSCETTSEKGGLLLKKRHIFIRKSNKLIQIYVLYVSGWNERFIRGMVT